MTILKRFAILAVIAVICIVYTWHHALLGHSAKLDKTEIRLAVWKYQIQNSPGVKVFYLQDENRGDVSPVTLAVFRNQPYAVKPNSALTKCSVVCKDIFDEKARSAGGYQCIIDKISFNKNAVVVHGVINYYCGGGTGGNYHLSYGNKGWYVESMTDVIVACP